MRYVEETIYPPLELTISALLSLLYGLLETVSFPPKADRVKIELSGKIKDRGNMKRLRFIETQIVQFLYIFSLLSATGKFIIIC